MIRNCRLCSLRITLNIIWTLFLILWAILGIIWSAISLSLPYFTFGNQVANIAILGFVIDGLFIITALCGMISLIPIIPIHVRYTLSCIYFGGLVITFFVEIIRLLTLMALFPTYSAAYGANAIVVACLFVLIAWFIVFLPFSFLAFMHVTYLRKRLRRNRIAKLEFIELTTGLSSLEKSTQINLQVSGINVSKS